MAYPIRRGASAIRRLIDFLHPERLLWCLLTDYVVLNPPEPEDENYIYPQRMSLYVLIC